MNKPLEAVRVLKTNRPTGLKVFAEHLAGRLVAL
jgi:hypothetical protein